MTTEPRTGFRDPTELTRWTRGFLCASVVVNAFLIWANAMEYQDLVHGDIALRPPLWALPFIPVVGLLTAVLTLTWVHRANSNIRALGATGLQFTPGWAVGWYFVPIANLWKPFQAMLEIWRASISPSEWWRQAGSALLWCWWLLWIFSFFVVDLLESAAWMYMVNFTDGGNREVLDAAADIITPSLRIPAALFLVAIVTRVYRMQMAHYRRNVATGRA